MSALELNKNDPDSQTSCSFIVKTFEIKSTKLVNQGSEQAEVMCYKNVEELFVGIKLHVEN